MGEEPLPKVARLPWRAGLFWWWQAFGILKAAKLKWYLVGFLFVFFLQGESKIIRCKWGEAEFVVTWAIYWAQCLLLPFMMSLIAMVAWAQMYSSGTDYRTWIRKFFSMHGRALLTIGGIYFSIMFSLSMIRWAMEWIISEQKGLWALFFVDSFSGLAVKVFFLLASMEVLFQHTAIKASLYRTWLGVRNNWSALITTMLGIVLFAVAISKMQMLGLVGKGHSEILSTPHGLWIGFVGWFVFPFFFAWIAITFFVMYREIFHSEMPVNN